MFQFNSQNIRTCLTPIILVLVINHGDDAHFTRVVSEGFICHCCVGWKNIRATRLYTYNRNNEMCVLMMKLNESRIPEIGSLVEVQGSGDNGE